MKALLTPVVEENEPSQKVPELRERLFPRKSQVMLISVQSREKRSITVPVPMFFVEDLVTALSAVMQAVLTIRPDLRQKLESKLPDSLREYDLQGLIRTGAEILREIRACGPLTLVDIEDPGEGLKVKITLI